MPFASIADLPENVRSVLPAKAQRLFRNVANGQLARGLSEERAFKSAWSALKNAGWEKGEDGKWHLEKAEPDVGDVHVTGGAPKKRKRRKRLMANKTVTMGKGGPGAAEEAFRDEFKIAKVDEDQRLVFGWFSVVEDAEGLVVDSDNDVIEPETLEKAAYDFVLNARVASERHEREDVGKLVESIVFTKEKQEVLGIDLGFVGWWGGFFVTDDDVWEAVKSGDFTAFSIGGLATREELPA